MRNNYITPTFEDIKILSSDISLEPGKMYRINATLSEVTT